MSLASHVVLELSSQLVTCLQQKRLRFACAESCTGGALAAAITACAGSSKVFDAGYVVYSNQAKQRLLAVTDSAITTHGAVSETVASQMLQGVIDDSGVDLAVAITGIAGPEGGTPEKPVGHVCIAWGSVQEQRVTTQLFGGSRADVQSQSVVFALGCALEFSGCLEQERSGNG